MRFALVFGPQSAWRSGKGLLASFAGSVREQSRVKPTVCHLRQVTAVATDFGSSLGRNFTIWGTAWIGESAYNATGHYHPQPSWTSGGPTLKHGRPLPFVTLKHWTPEAEVRMGFSVTAVGDDGAEELTILESEVRFRTGCARCALRNSRVSCDKHTLTFSVARTGDALGWRDVAGLLG